MELEDLDNEIEKQKEIIKYIEFTEDKIFNKEEIISALKLIDYAYDSDIQQFV